MENQQNPPPESFKLLTISVEKLPASMDQRSRILSWATQRARLLLGCYRTGDANDPETYVAAIAAVLAGYPEHVITEVTHPVTGLPTRLTWLPTVKEVFDACQAAVYSADQARIRDKRIAEQLAARAEEDRLRAGRRLTVDELKAKYGGEKWGLSEPPRKPPEPAPSWAEVTRQMQDDPTRLQRLLNTDSSTLR